MGDIVILSGARTAIGTMGGSLATTPPIALGAHVAKAAMDRAGVEPGQVGQVVYGHVINTEPRDMYLSRVAAIEAGIPDATPAMNVNRLCGSGAQAIVSVVQALAMGDAEFGLAGGAESMSRSPYIVPQARWGQKMGDIGLNDMMLGALSDPFGAGHMGVTAENVAAEYGVSREDMDAFALESQTRASAAIEARHFASQIVPFEVKKRREIVAFDTDEHPKATTLDALGGLRAGVQEGRRRHRRQRIGHQRWGSGPCACPGRCSRCCWAFTPGQDRWLCPCRCAAGGDGHRPDPGGREIDGAHRTNRLRL